MWWVLYFKDEHAYKLIKGSKEPDNYVIENGIKYHGIIIGHAGLIF